jgi:ActR/RegA family two-component response regulator
MGGRLGTRAKSVHQRKQRRQTLLLVADDYHILITARAVLLGRGYRVLAADSVASAIQLLDLKEIAINFLVIRERMPDWEVLRNYCLACGSPLLSFHGSAEDDVIILRGLEAVGIAQDKSSCRLLVAGTGSG